MSNPTRTGRCLCGAIKYELSGPSATPYYSTICHCLNCRRGTGSMSLTASICPKDGFSVTQGAEHQKEYQDTATESGKPLKRVSCNICSSMLFAFTPIAEHIISVAAGTLDDSDSWKPDTEQYYVHRAEFVEKIKDVAKERSFKTNVRGETE